MEEKLKLIHHLEEFLDERIASAYSAMESARESKNQETKSSAGDKFETGRVMMQREEEKSEAQWAQLKELKLKLVTIKTASNSRVSLGSLINTNQGKYFISIGIGKFQVGAGTYLVISPESPVGSLMIGKVEGDKITFNTRQIEIIKII